MTPILLVEDHPDTVSYFQDKLLEKGYEVDVARDGEEALQRLSPSRHAIVVLDVHIPAITGDEVCRRIRANPDTADIPVVFITADGSRFVRDLLEPGKTVCLEKAVSTAELVRVLDDLTQGWREKNRAG